MPFTRMRKCPEFMASGYGLEVSQSLESCLYSHGNDSTWMRFFGLSKLSLRSLNTPLVATSLASTQMYLFSIRPFQMCLCELLLLAKVRSELCFEIFVIKDATCFLTVPPYSGGVFKSIGSCRDPLSHYRNQYAMAFSVHLGEGNPLSSVTEPKGFGKRPVEMRKAILRKYVTVCEGRWYLPSLWEVEHYVIRTYLKEGDSLLHYSEVPDLRKWKSVKTAKVSHSRFSLYGLLKVEEDLHFDFHSLLMLLLKAFHLRCTLGDAARSGGMATLTGSGLGSISLSSS
ncbi:hypothetical protein Tco_0659857 [Tanacetum coccineum]